MAEISAKWCSGRTVSFSGRVCYVVSLKQYLDPYIHEPQVLAGIQDIGPNGNFSQEEMVMIDGRNALSVFPSVAKKLGLM